jgi:hypothetical protein
MGIVEAMALTKPYSVSGVCHAALKRAAPDFSHLPEGRPCADGQSNWTFITLAEI